MSHNTGDDHPHGRLGGAIGKAKEIFGVVLHNDELVEEGQIEEEEAAAEVGPEGPAIPPSRGTEHDQRC